MQHQPGTNKPFFMIQEGDNNFWALVWWKGAKYSPGLYFLDKISFPTFPNMSPLIKKKENLAELGKNKSKDFFFSESALSPRLFRVFQLYRPVNPHHFYHLCIRTGKGNPINLSEQVKEIQSIYPNRGRKFNQFIRTGEGNSINLSEQVN